MELPLHGGKVPRWMLKYMRNMAEKIVEIIVYEYGPEKLLEGLSDPLWFQAFNNVIGMDWDSSGSTTVLTGILKDISWKHPELGFLVLGGKGMNALRVPEEAIALEHALGISSTKVDEIINSSRLAAKTDTAFLQDGYQLYHHTVIAVETGKWIIVQQGLNPETRMARRYHVNKKQLLEPHTGIAGFNHGTINLNLTLREAEDTLNTITDISQEPINRLARLIQEANSQLKPNILTYLSSSRPQIPLRGYHKPVKVSKHLIRALQKLGEYKPSSPEELALVKGAGPAVIRALVLVADLIYGIPSPDKDKVSHPIQPYAYAYAVGGKDGIPYPFNPRTAQKTVEVLEYALENAKIGDHHKLRALKRLRKTLPWWRKHGI